MQSGYEVTVLSDTSGIFTDYVLRFAHRQELLVCADTAQEVFAIFDVSMDTPSPGMLVYGLTSSSAHDLCAHTRSPVFALNAINRVPIPQE
jgi:hypothetical protein